MRQSRFLLRRYEVKLYILFAVLDLLIIMAYPMVYLYHQVRKVSRLGHNKRS
jgi:hypothetical protein